MGAEVVSSAEGGRLPADPARRRRPHPDHLRDAGASAQVKSAVLLAGLNAPGITTVIEAEATRDHTERMLRHFGAAVRVAPHGGARRHASSSTAGRSSGRSPVVVPADPSSAAFPLVAALIVPGSDVVDRGRDDEPAAHRAD